MALATSRQLQGQQTLDIRHCNTNQRQGKVDVSGDLVVTTSGSVAGREEGNRLVQNYGRLQLA